MDSILNFSDIKISTETIIAVSNLTFDLNLLYNYLPVTDYVVVKRKRGRKKKVETVNPNEHIKNGAIISVQNKTNVRGAVLKKKKESKTYFLNSITVILVIEKGKIINTKISKNGKFQITGCKDTSHFLKAIQYIYKHIKDSERQIGETICSLKPDSQYSHPKIIFNIVMKNIDFKVGFSIQRDKLDTFISVNTNFHSHYEGSITTGVNIKIKSKTPYDKQLECLDIVNDNFICSRVDYSEYLSLLEEKEKLKEIKKEKYHTFLVFCSGSIIQSGSGPEMENVYNDFMKILMTNREHFEEKLDV